MLLWVLSMQQELRLSRMSVCMTDNNILVYFQLVFGSDRCNFKKFFLL